MNKANQVDDLCNKTRKILKSSHKLWDNAVKVLEK